MTDCCTSQIDACIIRGDVYTQTIALDEGFAEVYEDPSLYELAMVFRRWQSDDQPVLLELTAELELEPSVEAMGVPPLVAQFTATPTQTSSLPAYNLVSYTELRLKTGGDNQRLFNSSVKVSD